MQGFDTGSRGGRCSTGTVPPAPSVALLERVFLGLHRYRDEGDHPDAAPL